MKHWYSSSVWLSLLAQPAGAGGVELVDLKEDDASPSVDVDLLT